MKPIVFIAVRTTGPDPDQDDIVELAAIRSDPRSLDVEETVALAVVPEFVGRAVSADDASEGFLADALERLEPVLSGAIVAGVDVDRTLAFLRRGWEDHGHEPDDLDEHPIEITTLAWPLMAATGRPDELTLDAVCEHFGIEHPEAGALDSTRCAVAIARALVRRPEDHYPPPELSADERAIARTLVERLRGGREQYGPWSLDDGRVYTREALLEIMDALHYCAAELVRLERRQRPDGVRTRRVYVCHPFGGDPVRNAERVRDICADLVREGFVPVAPALYLPQFITEESERELALRLCLELLDDCDEVRVYGSDITDGMRREIARAEARGIEVKFLFPLGGEPDARAETSAWS